MAKGVDFSSILDKRVEDIESPRPLPAGTYRGLITGPPKEDNFERKNDDGSTTNVPVAVLAIAIQEALSGVDEDLLASAGGLRRRDGKPREVQMRYYLEEESLHKLKKLGKSCGIQGNTLRDIFEQLGGCEVQVDLQVQQSRNDPDDWFQKVVRVVGTAA